VSSSPAFYYLSGIICVSILWGFRRKCCFSISFSFQFLLAKDALKDKLHVVVIIGITHLFTNYLSRVVYLAYHNLVY
jgi:hypothetical protein